MSSTTSTVLLRMLSSRILPHSLEYAHVLFEVEIRDQAVSEGMLTLRMDGMKKIERGITTLEEVVKETAE